MLIELTNKVLSFADFRKYSDTLIESGSFGGDGIQRAVEAGFEYIKSVEALPELYHYCQERFLSNPKVHLYLGMSKDEFPKMLRNIDYPVVFFLDAHPSGEGTFGHSEDIAPEYQQDNILTSELSIIFAHRNDHVIILDDQNGDSRHCRQILNANPNYTFYFYDEKRGDKLYKNKLLVALPC